MMTRDDLLNLIPAYAIGALDDDERIALEALLETDTEAQESLEDYEAIADVIAFTVPERPAPTHLKDDLKARLAARPKIVPKEQPASTLKQSQKRQPTQLSSILIASAAAILIVVIGIGLFLSQDTAPTLSPDEELFNQIVASTNFTQFEITPLASDDATGELVIDSDGGQAVLRIDYVPDRTDEESYQLWFIDGENVQSAGLFYWPTGLGPHFVRIEEPLGDVDTIAMTIEPYEGSPLENSPTGDILFGVELKS